MFCGDGAEAGDDVGFDGDDVVGVILSTGGVAG
jgi:hypothetical protein